ncbi:MAG: transposase, partial [Puniceicoccaceae bacterium]
MKRFIKNDGGIYHCMSRTVQGRRFLGAVEREVLRKMIWQLADFSGLRVITYCLMNNHFHILVEVPKEQAVDDAELVRRFSVLYPKGHKRLNLRAVDLAAELEAGARGDELRDWLLGRMGDLSIFMKILKQRFSIWYNETHETFGAVWAERFKSVLVEGRRFVLQAMAAYIDLNPVRAGLVKDPKDYRFCGYGEAVVGNSAARAGVQRVMGVFAPEGNAQAALAGYRTLLYQRGSDAVDGRGAISERAVEQ